MTTTNEAKPLTPEQFETEMKAIFNDGDHDTEIIHVYMDELMTELLKSLGYEAGIKVFDDTDKWYVLSGV